jgi:hypothetical protein
MASGVARVLYIPKLRKEPVTKEPVRVVVRIRVLGFPNILKKGTDLLSTQITIIVYCSIVVVNNGVLGLTNILNKSTGILFNSDNYFRLLLNCRYHKH